MQHPSPQVYGIPNCDTVKKARAWLAAQGETHDFHDFKKTGVTVRQLQGWAKTVGWERLLNRQGTTWRRIDPATQARVTSADAAIALMTEQPSLIKRPVVEWPDGQVTVGFDPTTWAARG